MKYIISSLARRPSWCMGSRGSGFTVPGIEEMAKLKGSTDFGTPLGIVGKGYQGGVNRHVYKIVFGSELGPDKNRPVAYLPVHVRLAPSTIPLYGRASSCEQSSPWPRHFVVQWSTLNMCRRRRSQNQLAAERVGVIVDVGAIG